MVVKYGNCLRRKLYYSVPCSFATAEDARNAVCYLALYPGRMEEQLNTLQCDFVDQDWTPEKIAYMEEQEGMINLECGTHGLDFIRYSRVETLDEFSEEACEFLSFSGRW